MRWSEALIQTLRDVPKDAEAASHKLALRASLVKQLSSGVYSYLPLGFRVLTKVANIIRDEMTKAGAVEVLLPALHPSELWKKTGRFESLGDDKISFENRSGHEFVLGPTHEEVITDLVGSMVKSFRDLPVTLYQIQTKFRDEARPRFGVIRTKEFIMKDAYSFDRDESGLDQNYQKMSEAYHQIFHRCGLTFQVVTADSGMMGGKMSQEFMVVCPYGEDRVAKSDGDYLASVEVATRANPNLKTPEAKSSKPVIFDTPGIKTIQQLAKKMRVKPEQLVKTMIYIADEKPIACLVTGDSEVNEPKLRTLVGAKTLRAATDEEIKNVTGASAGSLGPVGLKLPIYADWDIQGLADFTVGANEDDKHMKNVNLERDFKADAFGDIRSVKEGDQAADGSGKLHVTTTMEVGHIFKLGTRYSEALNANFLDEKGKQQTVIMGCYGIGVNRILAATIEEHHDDKGIIWPKAIAPFDVELIPLNIQDEKTSQVAEDLYRDLTADGIEVLYDDRDERAGVKFKDADLIGIPKQVILGERNLKDGKVEIKDRATGEAQLMELGALKDALRSDLSRSGA